MNEIATHPLSEFFRAIIREYDRGALLHGRWEDLSDMIQVEAIRREYIEWLDAYASGDIDGDHGEKAELSHLINCCLKRWEQLKRREGK